MQEASTVDGQGNGQIAGQVRSQAEGDRCERPKAPSFDGTFVWDIEPETLRWRTFVHDKEDVYVALVARPTARLSQSQVESLASANGLPLVEAWVYLDGYLLAKRAFLTESAGRRGVEALVLQTVSHRQRLSVGDVIRLASRSASPVGKPLSPLAGERFHDRGRRRRAELTGQLAAALHRVRTLEQLERNRERAPGSEMGAELVEKGRRIASLEQELKRAREKGDAVTRKFAEEFQAREKAEMDLLKAQRAGNDLQTKLRMSETTVAKLTELGAEAERWKNRADKAETELGKLRAVVGTPPMPPMAKGWGIMRRLGRQGTEWVTRNAGGHFVLGTRTQAHERAHMLREFGPEGAEYAVGPYFGPNHTPVWP